MVDVELFAVKVGTFVEPARTMLMRLEHLIGVPMDDALAQQIADYVYGMDVQLDDNVKRAIVAVWPSIIYGRPELAALGTIPEQSSDGG